MVTFIKNTFRYLFLPTLSEYETVGVIIIGLTCTSWSVVGGVVFSNSYGIDLASRMAIAGVSAILIAYLIYRLSAIFKHAEERRFTHQKIIDRIIATFIIGFAAVNVFQHIVDTANGAPLLSNASTILDVYVGMRAFVNVTLLSLYIDYASKYAKNTVPNTASYRALGTLLHNTYSDEQVNTRIFLGAVLVALVSSVVAIIINEDISRQIVQSYALFIAVSAVFRVKKLPSLSPSQR